MQPIEINKHQFFKIELLEVPFNQTHAGVRSTVERVFGVLKQHYAMGKARYLGLGRNRTRVELMCVAHNIKRGLSIRQGQCA